MYLRDLRFQPPASQSKEIQAFLRSDRVRRFNIAQAPLMRLALFRLAEASYQFIIAFHHAILDGWSLNLVLKEFAQFQEAYYRRLDVDLPLTRPYAQYIHWLQQRDVKSSEIYWRRLLASYQGSARMSIDRALGEEQQPDSGAGEHCFHLSRAINVALQAFARQHAFTLNTLVQAAWSLLLNCYTGERDVAFGTVVSGRPPELVGVESMVGLFINTIPTRSYFSGSTSSTVAEKISGPAARVTSAPIQLACANTWLECCATRQASFRYGSSFQQFSQLCPESHQRHRGRGRSCVRTPE